MITIDGGAKSGSGTIVRYSVALASLLGEELDLCWHSNFGNGRMHKLGS
jgi:hypothetical protein